jgi:hypothetical protein
MEQSGGGGFSLANLFRPSSGVPASPVGGTGTPNPAGPNDPARGLDLSNPGAGGLGSPDGGVKNPTEGKGPDSPLDAFTDLFTIDPKKPVPKDPLAEPLLKLDPKTLGEAVAKMDFTKNLPPDLVAKALQGDANAFAQALNGATRASFMQITQMVTGLIEGAVRTNNGRYDSALESRFRTFQLNSSTSTNKALEHPAAKPVVAALKSSIAQMHPELSAADVQKRAEDYFLGMSKAITSVGEEGAGGTAGNRGEPAEQDWSKYL